MQRLLDPFHLERFIDPQDRVISDVRAELGRGRKTSHWMWFIFPQIAGLGRSAMAERYAIGSLEEARAYLAHPVLGPRLLECTRLMLGTPSRTAREILGTPDDLKFRSSMTLFRIAAPQESLFASALERYFDAAPDPLTLEHLGLRE
jgi:uncharacterized protein (DUF1810 family)